LAKIAVEFEASNTPRSKLLDQGDGWSAADIVCTSGPRDRPFEERHSSTSIAIVVSGSFQYRSCNGREMMTPGSLLLGNHGNCFECGHEHGTGDRCIAFSYDPGFFERIAAEAGGARDFTGFNSLRLPPLRLLSPLIAKASAALQGSTDISWAELAVQLAAQAVQLDGGLSTSSAGAEPAAEARVTRVVRLIDAQPDAGHDLASLAREARLSPYHFLRTFESLTGVTPHQYVLRARLRRAAVQLTNGPAKILDIALECGFGDVSNFNRNFRAEFGVSPRVFRRQMRPS